MTGLQQQVRAWCGTAARAGYFAPLRGELATAVIDLINWPRWTSKLLAMHRHMRLRLQAARPRLVIAPAEKDWPAYCGLHAARALGIPTVGIKHGIWFPGTRLERYMDRCFYPPAADVVAAYTPEDAEAARRGGLPAGSVRWLGNPRLGSGALVPDAEDHPNILLACCGVGPGLGAGFHKRIVPRNRDMITALHKLLGDRLHVRLHPWDRRDHYPDLPEARLLPADEPLLQQLSRCSALVTTYSLSSLDAVAAGKPALIWDADGMNMAADATVRKGAAIVAGGLDDLCREIQRFTEDEPCRRSMLDAAAAFAAELSRGADGRQLANDLRGLMREPDAPAGKPDAAQSARVATTCM